MCGHGEDALVLLVIGELSRLSTARTPGPRHKWQKQPSGSPDRGGRAGGCRENPTPSLVERSMRCRLPMHCRRAAAIPITPSPSATSDPPRRRRTVTGDVAARRGRRAGASCRGRGAGRGCRATCRSPPRPAVSSETVPMWRSAVIAGTVITEQGTEERPRRCSTRGRRPSPSARRRRPSGERSDRIDREAGGIEQGAFSRCVPSWRTSSCVVMSTGWGIRHGLRSPQRLAMVLAKNEFDATTCRARSGRPATGG